MEFGQLCLPMHFHLQQLLKIPPFAPHLLKIEVSDINRLKIIKKIAKFWNNSKIWVKLTGNQDENVNTAKQIA